ncbi:hypothetical protein HN011_009288, partial [Eciton burchellii]
RSSRRRETARFNRETAGVFWDTVSKPPELSTPSHRIGNLITSAASMRPPSATRRMKGPRGTVCQPRQGLASDPTCSKWPNTRRIASNRIITP